MGDNFRNLGNQINVPLHVDEDGYFGRECPVKECLGYFKVTGHRHQGARPLSLPLLRAQRGTRHVLHAGTDRLRTLRYHAQGHGCFRGARQQERI